jgi:anti-sigma regulatory factor (Ser/Thr protein kinase)
LIDARETFADEPQIEVRSCVPGWTHLRIIPALGLREILGGYVRELLSDLPSSLCEDLSLAVDELVSNAIEHGCRQDIRCPIDLRIIRTEGLLLFQITDPGEGFSVDKIDHAAVNNPPDEPLRHTQFRDELGMRPGGFGILLVKKIADELIYNEAGNEVLLVKYLDGI